MMNHIITKGFNRDGLKHGNKLRLEIEVPLSALAHLLERHREALMESDNNIRRIGKINGELDVR